MSVCHSLTRISFLVIASALLCQPVLAAGVENQTPINQVQSGTGTDASVMMMSSTQQTEPSHYHDDNNLYALNGVSSKDFGGTGPISIAGLYDNEVGYFLDAMGSVPLGDRFAAALELAGGEYIFRANGTVGFAINPKNRIKATVENLREDLEYDYESGTIRHWESQMAYGGAYEYVFGGKYLDALDVGGYFSHSSSDRLAPKSFGNNTATTGRFITGADNYDVNTFVKYHFWPKSQLKTGLSWDKASFEYKYEDENESGLGVILGIDQLITEQIKVSLDSSIGAVEDTVTGQVGVLLPVAPKGTRLELAYVTDYVHGHTTDRDFYTNGIKAAFSWGYPKTSKTPSYTADFGPINQQTLQQWTSDPAVRMSEVIAFADQATATSGGMPPPPPAPRAFADSCPGTLSKADEVDGTWHAAPNEAEAEHGIQQDWTGQNDPGSRDPSGDVSFNQVEIRASQSGGYNHGEVSCNYTDGNGGYVTVSNEEVYAMEVDVEPVISPTVSAATLRRKAHSVVAHRRAATLTNMKSVHKTTSLFKKKSKVMGAGEDHTPWGPSGYWSSVSNPVNDTYYGTCDTLAHNDGDDDSLKGNPLACQFQAEYSGDVAKYNDQPNMDQYDCAKDPASCQGNGQQSQLAKRFSRQLAQHRVIRDKLAKLKQHQKIQSLENKLKTYKKN